jgi:hypothetical protein
LVVPEAGGRLVQEGQLPQRRRSLRAEQGRLEDLVTAVAKRYKGQGLAYQILERANLSTTWSGTPQQLADLTQAAKKIIRSTDPTATVVSASSTVRLTASYEKFFPAYLKALKKDSWPVDALLRPPVSGRPGHSRDPRRLHRAGAGRSRSGWRPRASALDTEINYGFSRSWDIPGWSSTVTPRRPTSRRPTWMTCG